MVRLANSKHRTYCIIVGCDSSYLDVEGDDNTSKLRFHKFPYRYPRVLKKWLNVLTLKRELQKNSLICSKHFTLDCYTSESLKRLHKNALPTLLIDKTQEDVVKKVQRRRRFSSSRNAQFTNDSGLQDDLKHYFGQLWDETMFACPDETESVLLVVKPEDNSIAPTTSNINDIAPTTSNVNGIAPTTSNVNVVATPTSDFDDITTIAASNVDDITTSTSNEVTYEEKRPFGITINSEPEDLRIDTKSNLGTLNFYNNVKLESRD